MIRFGYEDTVRIHFDRIMADLERYFVDIPIECPYGLPYTAIFRQAAFGRLPDEIVGLFFNAGYRRSGNSFYTMACRGCTACIPIRLRPPEFVPNRNQKRVARSNADVAMEIEPLRLSHENLSLCRKFLNARYPARGSTAEEYYSGFFLNNVTNTFEMRYRLAGRLIGTAIVDIGIGWLNAVYFYFDPEEGKRSPGTLNILSLIGFCREKKIPYLYLGYLINEVSAMRYKANFRPHYVLTDGKWVCRDRLRPGS